MVAQVAREYEGKVSFLTAPGQDTVPAMERAVEEFGWPASMTHAVDSDGSLWEHFKIRYRGAWVFLDDDGKVIHQSVTHISEAKVRENLEKLVAA